LKIAVYDVGFEEQAGADARVNLPIVESVIWTELT
jgi:hypothetical protein